jgi:hypothetical protein
LQSRQDYSAFMLKELVQYVSTPFVLVAQWDGYVLDPCAWRGEFFEYDYIGAVWPFHRDGMRVGNGGFSLRSAKLLRSLAEAPFEYIPGTNEDDLICRHYRPQLEAQYGIRFAPEDVAARFAYEHVRPDTPTFGFHGAFNMWRHVDDITMMDIAARLDARTFTSSEVMLLLKVYCDLRKFDCVRAMYERYRRLWSTEQVVHNMMKTGLTDQAVLQYVDICEGVLRNAGRGLVT